MNYQKYLAPAFIELYTVIGLVIILLITIAFIMVKLRNTPLVRAVIWLPKELLKIYSNEESFFSKKRIESGIGFFAGTGIICCYVWTHRNSMSNWDMVIDAGVLLGIAGYNISKIQTEKLSDKTPPQDEPK